MDNKNHAWVVHAIALTVHNKSFNFGLKKRSQFSLTPVSFCYILTYLSPKINKQKDFKTLYHSLYQATVSFHPLKYSSSNLLLKCSHTETVNTFCIQKLYKIYTTDVYRMCTIYMYTTFLI